MIIEWEKRETGECEKIEDIPKGAKIISVDDKMCVGVCEDCSQPILDDEYFVSDSDGVLVCEKCLKQYKGIFK